MNYILILYKVPLTQKLAFGKKNKKREMSLDELNTSWIVKRTIENGIYRTREIQNL